MKQIVNKGDVFWYRYKGACYGGIILDVQGEGQRVLISISEKISLNRKSIGLADVLDTEIYTLAWFSPVSLLGSFRTHIVGHLLIEGSFNGRAGLLYSDDGSLIVKNEGQMMTWHHTFRAYVLKGRKMSDVLSPTAILKTRFG